ncbi:MAG: chemotaxis protein CheW [Oscillospiraceae bacterium]|jgi:purine-binding chemotaxis protein CheW
MEDILNAAAGSDEQWKYLIFSVNGIEYGIEIGYVTEIIGVQPITQVPRTADYIKGIINIRGTIIPVMDMRLRFGYEESEYDEKTCIISVNKDNVNLGLIVDAVVDVIQLSADTILTPPADGGEAKNRFLKAIGKYQDTVKQLVDIDKIYGIEPAKT